MDRSTGVKPFPQAKHPGPGRRYSDPPRNCLVSIVYLAGRMAAVVQGKNRTIDASFCASRPGHASQAMHMYANARTGSFFKDRKRRCLPGLPNFEDLRRGPSVNQPTPCAFLMSMMMLTTLSSKRLCIPCHAHPMFFLCPKVCQ